MNNVVHFNMILEINQLLKQNNIEYSIHGVGGCTCCGLELRQEGKSYPTDKILEVINGYLKNHWIYVQENKYQPGFLTIHSKFDKKPSTNLVLPEPNSPVRTTTSFLCKKDANFLAKLFVSASFFV